MINGKDSVIKWPCAWVLLTDVSLSLLTQYVLSLAYKKREKEELLNVQWSVPVDGGRYRPHSQVLSEMAASHSPGSTSIVMSRCSLMPSISMRYVYRLGSLQVAICICRQPNDHQLIWVPSFKALCFIFPLAHHVGTEASSCSVPWLLLTMYQLISHSLSSKQTKQLRTT